MSCPYKTLTPLFQHSLDNELKAACQCFLEDLGLFLKWNSYICGAQCSENTCNNRAVNVDPIIVLGLTLHSQLQRGPIVIQDEGVKELDATSGS